jgi:hypothetical protein
MLSQTVLPFKLESTDETLTAQGGLAATQDAFRMSRRMLSGSDAAIGREWRVCGAGAGESGAALALPARVCSHCTVPEVSQVVIYNGAKIPGGDGR